MNIYLASSWRNVKQPTLVSVLRDRGHAVYDFRSPDPSTPGFSWADVAPGWKSWTVNEYRVGLIHPRATAGFQMDWQAMQWADACVLLLPCGRSAHLEAGWFVGAGKPVFVLLADEQEPELMYKMCLHLAGSVTELVEQLELHERPVVLQKPIAL